MGKAWWRPKLKTTEDGSKFGSGFLLLWVGCGSTKPTRAIEVQRSSVKV